ncbi:MAG: putative toxin-antitoxin system toxin component, PIN family [Patescibacteria group bacterium]
MVRILLDTNVLITADRGMGSYSRRILDLILQGKIEAIVSHQVKRENLLIVNKLVKDESLKYDIRLFLDNCVEIRPALINLKLEDQEDIKLLAAAVGGKAHFLITEDRHLLEIDEGQPVKIVTPKAFWQWWEKQQDESGDTWNSWAQNIFGK